MLRFGGGRFPSRASTKAAAVLLTLCACGSAVAGGVAILRTELTDNGDDDGFADTRETVTLRLHVWNKSGIALTGVTARLHTLDGARACLLDNEIAIGSLAPDEVRITAEGFVLVVSPSVNRTDPYEDLSAFFEVEIGSDQISDLSDHQRLALDLDLDVSGGSAPSSFLEGFEVNHGFGQFEAMNLDEGRYQPGDCCGGPSWGYRCQHSVPACGASCESGLDCTLGTSESQVDDFYWQIDGPRSPGDGRAYTGTRSLYMGVYLPDPPGGYSTPIGALEAVGMSQAVHLNWARICEISRQTACDDATDCPPGEACVQAAPVLSFKHQISLLDSRASGTPPGQSADRGVVQVQVADDTGEPAGDWIKVYPYQNVHDQQATDVFDDCAFDPVDDGNDENSVYNPQDPSSDHGPSSTCNPELNFVYLGDTDDPFDPANVGNASDGPGLAGASGPGTWVESRFDLSRFRGRSIRIRFLSSTIRLGYDAVSVEEAFGINPDPGDDGWWIDDVSIGDTLENPATVVPDTKDNSGLPVNQPDGDGDGVYDVCDNCPEAPNDDQADQDFDRAGDDCDPCPRDPEDDSDGDGTCMPEDNCPGLPNPGQGDRDADGFGDDCDLCPDLWEPWQFDGDQDGWGDGCDCAPADPWTHPGAPEINDGLDNQCPGDVGNGVVDETSGDSGFHDPDDKTEYSWPGQGGATGYEVARSSSVDFSSDCVKTITTVTTWHDAATPPSGWVFYYLNRPSTPLPGSWGQDSSGAERTAVCP